jgi:class 3 adenylate cyclase
MEAPMDSTALVPTKGGAIRAAGKPMAGPDAWLRLLLLLVRVHQHAPRVVGDLLRQNRALRARLTRARQRARRLDRLRGFFSPQVADLIVSCSATELLRAERREVTVVFVDLRGFTMFTQTSDPEEVRLVLSEFHAEVGRLAHAWRGTIERFTGDGLMIFFNAPHAVSGAPEAAVRFALAIRARFYEFAPRWWARGHELDLGVGIAHGFATVGVIGFEGRRDYGVIGNVTNLAARLCREAQGSQILTGRGLVAALEPLLETDFVGDLVLKGFVKPVAAFSVRGLRAEAAHAADVTSGRSGCDGRSSRG